MASAARPLAPPGARRRGVLAFTCAVHVLALFLWMQERRFLPVRPQQRVTIFLQTDRGQPARPPAEAAPVPLPMPATPAIPAVPAVAPQPGQAARRDDEDDAPAARQRDPRVVDTPAAAPPAAPSTPNAAALPPNPFDTAQPAAPSGTPSGQGSFTLGLAKQQAGRIDRELRKGKPGIPIEADTPSARFQRGVESAHVDRTLTWQSDTYTSPDGVVIYRFRQGNRVRCRRAGGVGMPLAGMPGTGSITMGGAGAAGSTDCPKGVVWNEDR